MKLKEPVESFCCPKCAGEDPFVQFEITGTIVALVTNGNQVVLQKGDFEYQKGSKCKCRNCSFCGTVLQFQKEYQRKLVWPEGAKEFVDSCELKCKLEKAEYPMQDICMIMYLAGKRATPDTSDLYSWHLVLEDEMQKLCRLARERHREPIETY